MLEMARKTGGKTISHLLAAHGGEIFIHTLSTARSVLEDPPSISEGCGGRVTDYRITVGYFCNYFELYFVKNFAYRHMLLVNSISILYKSFYFNVYILFFFNREKN